MMSNSHQDSSLGPNRLDVIVRLHDSSRLAELKRAIFSLICQDYRPLTINLVTQRFSNDETDRVLAHLESILKLDPDVTLRAWNYTASEPKDARSALLNLGIERASGRFLAILDYDDVIYSDSYTKLVNELQDSGSAIAFGKVIMKHIDLFEDALICERQQHRFKGNGVVDLFAENFCPIHSFVIDKNSISDTKLWFDEGFDKLEDYDFLIRLCAEHVSSFNLKDVIVGEYYAKNDGSNTIMLAAATQESHLLAWTRAREAIEERRQTCIVSREVQTALNLPSHDPAMTVRNLIDQSNGARTKFSAAS